MRRCAGTSEERSGLNQPTNLLDSDFFDPTLAISEIAGGCFNPGDWGHCGKGKDGG